jgi:hypothetical protein
MHTRKIEDYQYGFRQPLAGLGKNPIILPWIGRLPAPHEKHLCRLRIERDWFLGRLSLAGADVLQRDRAGDVNNEPLEVHVGPFKREQFAQRHRKSAGCLRIKPGVDLRFAKMP